jgi:hypothetical protein
MPQRTKDPTQALFEPYDPPERFEAPFDAPESLDLGFLEILAQMTSAERISASRHGGFTRRERSIWAARYSDEVPLVNGEFEWIASGLADLD